MLNVQAINTNIALLTIFLLFLLLLSQDEDKWIAKTHLTVHETW